MGRSRTAEDPVRAAVVAHVRHEHTDYDDLMDSSEGDREERADHRNWARGRVRAEIDAVLKEWECTPPLTNEVQRDDFSTD